MCILHFRISRPLRQESVRSLVDIKQQDIYTFFAVKDQGFPQDDFSGYTCAWLVFVVCINDMCYLEYLLLQFVCGTVIVPQRILIVSFPMNGMIFSLKRMPNS